MCEALNTCGAYYVRGQAKERLSRYLVYFQRYLLSKPLLPTHIEFAILDTFDNLEELARSAAIASAVKLKSAAPALKVLNSLSVFFTWIFLCYFSSVFIVWNPQVLRYRKINVSTLNFSVRFCCLVLPSCPIYCSCEKLFQGSYSIFHYLLFNMSCDPYVSSINIYRARTQPPHLLH